MRLHEILETTSGAVAAVAQPIGNVIRRSSIFASAPPVAPTKVVKKKSKSKK